MKNSITALLLILSLFSCSSPKKQESKRENYPITFSGTFKNPELESDIKLIKLTPLPITSFNEEESVLLRKQDSTYSIRLVCDTFLRATFSVINSQRQNIFITPGDSLTFVADTIHVQRTNRKVTRSIFRFSGKNAAHYNYDFMLDLSVQPLVYYYRYINDPVIYKEKLVDLKNKKMAFLEEYASKYSVSPEFYNYAKSNIQNQYIISLYDPLERGLVKREELPDNYFDNLPEIANPLLGSYGGAITMKHLLSKSLYYADKGESLADIRDYILNKTEGHEQEYLYTVAVALFAKRNELLDSAAVMQMAQEAPLYVINNEYLDYINQAKEIYSPSPVPMPPHIQSNTKLQSYEDGQVYTLKEVLEKLQGKTIYLDFWASWCAPCVADIKNSADAKHYLQKNGIEYVYISIDNKAENWKKAVEQNKIAKHQYLLLKEENKKDLTDYFVINEIPRYTILNKKHQIVSDNAPRPIPDMQKALERRIEAIK